MTAVVLISSPASSQYFFDFEKGLSSSWVQSPPGRWQADTLSPLNGLRSLHHTYDNSSSATDRISYYTGRMLFPRDTFLWQFTLRHLYPPSSANHWGVFLASNQPSSRMSAKDTSTEALIVGVNFTGNDDLLKFWHLRKGKAEEIFNTGFNWQEKVGPRPATVRITRSPAGEWTFEIDTSSGGRFFSPLGKVLFPTSFPALFFGLSYTYSSARDQALWFDDLFLRGSFEKDTLPPFLRSIAALAPHLLFLSFSEEVLIATASFQLSGIDSFHIFQLSGDSLLISPLSSLAADSLYSLTISGIRDVAGNSMHDTSVLLCYHPLQWGEVVINEIMADPSPPVGLPEAEYLELFNTTQRPIWLYHCHLLFDQQDRLLSPVNLPPHSFLIVSRPEDCPLFRPYGRCVGVKQMPSLLNDGMSLALLSAEGKVISHVSYSKMWYGDPYKAEGGWSLEQVDPYNPCSRRDNWHASRLYPGGTPGDQNSIYASNPDYSPTRLTNIYPTGAVTCRLGFSEPYDPATLLPSRFLLIPGHLHPDTVICHLPEYRTADLIFQKPFQKGTLYHLEVEKIRDCSGNLVELPETLRFALPDSVAPDEVVINELLYNPRPGGADYVELYNRSSHVFDLSSLFLMHRDTSTQSLTHPVRITALPRLFFPGDYCVVTPDPDAVQTQYFSCDPASFLSVAHLPPLPDERGNIVLTNTQMQVIDEFHYDDAMQFPLLRNTEGISLERIDPDAPASDPFNWHSAASDAGYGTPGIQNSQYSPPGEEDVRHLYTEPEIISPDNDGYHDVLHIRYQFDHPGSLATVTVYNAEGQLIRIVANNYLLGTHGDIVWDGLDRYGQRPPTGIYLILVEIYDLQGRVKRYKRTCIVAGRRG